MTAARFLDYHVSILMYMVAITMRHFRKKRELHFFLLTFVTLAFTNFLLRVNTLLLFITILFILIYPFVTYLKAFFLVRILPMFSISI